MAKPTIDRSATWATLLAQTVGDTTRATLFQTAKSDRHNWPASMTPSRATKWWADDVDAFIHSMWLRHEQRGVLFSADYSTIQAAINAASAAGGGVVEIAAGSHTINLTLPANVHLRGQGRGRTVITGQISIQGSNVAIRDLSLTGVSRLITWPSAADVENIVIDNCHLYSGTSEGIYATTGVTRVNRIVISNCIIEGCTRGIVLQADETSDVVLSACIIDDCDTNGIIVGNNDVAFEDTYVRVVVSDNIVTNIGDVSQASDVKGILVYGLQATITGNVVQNVNHDGTADCEGIYTKCRSAVIAGNSLYNAGWDQGAIACKGEFKSEDGTTPRGYGVVIADNIIKNDRVGSPVPILGIYCTVDHSIIANNIIEGAFSPTGSGNYGAIDLAGNRDVLVDGNVIFDCAIDAGIRFSATSRMGGAHRIVIRNNTVRNNDRGTPGIAGVASGVTIAVTDNSGIDDVLIENNIFNGMMSTTASNGLCIWIWSTAAGREISNLVIKNNYFANANTAISATVSDVADLNTPVIFGNRYVNLSVAKLSTTVRENSIGQAPEADGYRALSADAALAFVHSDDIVELSSTTGTKAATFAAAGEWRNGKVLRARLTARSGGSYTIAATQGATSGTVTLDAAGEGVDIVRSGTTWRVLTLHGGATFA